ncbi:aldose 1-epimerase [Tumebacillus flagellatus]|uniref:Aldose epimerase n=1 Tax=Tumebacillus flagellatus TaxID=1157490 RepID=A0A074LXQ9_9BACL|nr:aldose 1-epimerase [Tumebacillus flagellatus]KEO84913.1 aldose epimerase [Tumebacillus flagellatus]
MKKQAPTVKKTHFHGEPAVELSVSSYTAVVLPHIGGNLVSLRETERGYRLLCEPAPDRMEWFRQHPVVHGIPVLFPPNRYEDGTFELAGRTYRWPVNDAEHGNHIHGFLYDREWEVYASGVTDQEAFVELRFVNHADAALYRLFPHAFEFRLKYVLSERGLAQEIAIANRGDDAMPCMLGFHTALNAPFAAGSSAQDLVVKATIGQRVEMSERMLPTGEFVELTGGEEEMRRDGVSPFFATLDHHYTAEAQAGRNYVALIDTREQVRLVYDAGTKYKYWMLFNADARSGYFCPEPQTNLVNAPRLEGQVEDTGFVILQPCEVWSEASRIWVESLKADCTE